MTTLRKVFVLGSLVFAMGAAAGCGDDDENGNPDAPVTFDARTADAAGSTADAPAAANDAAPRD
jgi:hypothetical protein